MERLWRKSLLLTEAAQVVLLSVFCVLDWEVLPSQGETYSPDSKSLDGQVNEMILDIYASEESSPFPYSPSLPVFFKNSTLAFDLNIVWHSIAPRDTVPLWGIAKPPVPAAKQTEIRVAWEISADLLLDVLTKWTDFDFCHMFRQSHFPHIWYFLQKNIKSAQTWVSYSDAGIYMCQRTTAGWGFLKVVSLSSCLFQKAL